MRKTANNNKTAKNLYLSLVDAINTFTTNAIPVTVLSAASSIPFSQSLKFAYNVKRHVRAVHVLYSHFEISRKIANFRFGLMLLVSEVR